MLIRPWDEPWATNYTRQQADALNRALGMPADQLRKIGPPLPQIQYLPPRFGYPTFEQRQWTVMQVFGITRKQPAMLPSRVDYTGDQSRTQASDRNTNSGDALGLGGVSW